MDLFNSLDKYNKELRFRNIWVKMVIGYVLE